MNIDTKLMDNGTVDKRIWIVDDMVRLPPTLMVNPVTQRNEHKAAVAGARAARRVVGIDFGRPGGDHSAVVEAQHIPGQPDKFRVVQARIEKDWVQ